MITSVFLLLCALAFGSFATVLISRVPAGKSIGGRSRCPQCGQDIPPRDNIPVVSYLLLEGRCRFCGKPIPTSYFFLELSALLLSALVVIPMPTLTLKTATFAFVILGLALSAIDLRFKRLPNGLVIWLTALLLILIGLDSSSDLSRLGRAVLVACSYSLFLLLLRLISRGGMGLGDVKFAFPVGLITAYLSLPTTFIAVASAFVTGAAVGLSLLVMSKAGRKTAIPFGPFLFFGGLIGLAGHIYFKI